MKVRNDTTLDSAKAAQLAWTEAEFRIRAAFALTRLDALDTLSADLLEADLFDNAYAIWDDYIDGRRADERFESMAVPEMNEQASIFARIVQYIPAKESFALARAAWGDETFEVFVSNPDGSIFGKLGWYATTSTLAIRRVPAVVGATRHDVGYDLTVGQVDAEVVAETVIHRDRVRLALHPMFARVAS
jgi:hypothetical protein